MDPVDQFHLPGMPPFAVPSDLGQYLERLKAVFPDEAAGVDSYFAELRQAYLYGLLYYFRGVDNERAREFERFTLTDKLDEHFRDPRLKVLLMADTPHWGSVPSRTSYLFDAMLRLAYFLGNYYPKGSSQKFADDLGRGLEARGGRILKCASVDKVIIENGAAAGVRISTVSKTAPEYHEFRAPIVVSNADALHTYRDLIGEEHCGSWPIEHLKSLDPSYACFLVHLGLRGMDPHKLAAAEGYYWNSFDPADVNRTVFKVFIPTHFDPDIAPPGCQILIVQKLSPVRIEDISDWPAHKQGVEDYIMGRLRQILPGLDSHIVVKMSASAMTSYRFTTNWQGAILGWSMSPGQLGEDRLPNTTPVKNLYLAGHWTQPGGGITPVIVSAQKVARMIITGKTETRDLAAEYFAFKSGAQAATPRSSQKVSL
jgi:prolycopene isomerase